MKLDKDFNEYTQEEKIQFMFKALVEKEADLNLSFKLNAEMEQDLKKERSNNRRLCLYNQHFSRTNYYLWFTVFIAFLVGFWIRGL